MSSDDERKALNALFQSKKENLPKFMAVPLSHEEDSEEDEFAVFNILNTMEGVLDLGGLVEKYNRIQNGSKYTWERSRSPWCRPRKKETEWNYLRFQMLAYLAHKANTFDSSNQSNIELFPGREKSTGKLVEECSYYENNDQACEGKKPKCKLCNWYGTSIFPKELEKELNDLVHNSESLRAELCKVWRAGLPKDGANACWWFLREDGRPCLGRRRSIEAGANGLDTLMEEIRKWKERPSREQAQQISRQNSIALVDETGHYVPLPTELCDHLSSFTIDDMYYPVRETYQLQETWAMCMHDFQTILPYADNLEYITEGYALAGTLGAATHQKYFFIDTARRRVKFLFTDLVRETVLGRRVDRSEQPSSEELYRRHNSYKNWVVEFLKALSAISEDFEKRNGPGTFLGSLRAFLSLDRANALFQKKIPWVTKESLAEMGKEVDDAIGKAGAWNELQETILRNLAENEPGPPVADPVFEYKGSIDKHFRVLYSALCGYAEKDDQTAEKELAKQVRDIFKPFMEKKIVSPQLIQQSVCVCYFVKDYNTDDMQNIIQGWKKSLLEAFPSKSLEDDLSHLPDFSNEHPDFLNEFSRKRQRPDSDE